MTERTLEATEPVLYLAAVHRVDLTIYDPLEVAESEMALLYSAEVDSLHDEIGVYGAIFDSPSLLIRRVHRLEMSLYNPPSEPLVRFAERLRSHLLDSYVLLTSMYPGDLPPRTVKIGNRLVRS